MRIGIDARFFGPRVGGGGLGRYVAELVTNLQCIDKENDYVLFLRKENFHECVITNGRFQKRLVDAPWYSVAEQRMLPREIWLQKLNLMHFPHWNVPIFSGTPFVVTLHDLILLDDPTSARATTRGPLTYGIKRLGYRIALRHAVKKSRHIIAVSDYTKSRVLEHFRVSPHKISVIHNGIVPARDAKNVSLRSLGVVEPYILTVGNAYPHKNLALAVKAFAQVHAQHPNAQFVHAGKRDQFVDQLEELAEEEGIDPQALRFLNLPTDDEVAALYRHASLFVYPSRIEGFGMPPLEAMAYGTPVVAANTSSLPEVLGQAAQYVDPDDEDDLAEVMARSLTSPASLQAYRDRGPAQSRQFSWETTAEQTLNVYLSYGVRRKPSS